jgi:hypothetical protein
MPKELAGEQPACIGVLSRRSRTPRAAAEGPPTLDELVRSFASVVRNRPWIDARDMWASLAIVAMWLAVAGSSPVVRVSRDA